MLHTSTRAIYSVTVTERSFVHGVLQLEKADFVRGLVRKSVGHLLPAELAALVEEYLFPHYWRHTEASWARSMALWGPQDGGVGEGKHEVCFWDNYMGESAMRAWCKLADKLGLTIAAREGPHGNITFNNAPNSTPYLVHLGRAGRYSHGALALHRSWPNPPPPGTPLDSTLPSPPPPRSPPPAINLPPSTSGGQQGRFRPASSASTSTAIARLRSGICVASEDTAKGTASAMFVPHGGAPHALPGSDAYERVLELGGWEEDVRLWDDEAVAACVALLGLKPVAGSGSGDAMKPRLRIVQGFGSEEGGDGVRM